MAELIDTLKQVVEKSVAEAYENLKLVVANNADDIEITDKSIALTLINYEHSSGEVIKYSRANSFKEILMPSKNTENIFFVVLSFDVDNDKPPETKKNLLQYVLFNRPPQGTNIASIKGKENGVEWGGDFTVWLKEADDPQLASPALELQKNIRTYNVFIKYKFFKLKKEANKS